MNPPVFRIGMRQETVVVVLTDPGLVREFRAWWAQESAGWERLK